jgi:hypothetical protein
MPRLAHSTPILSESKQLTSESSFIPVRREGAPQPRGLNLSLQKSVISVKTFR